MTTITLLKGNRRRAKITMISDKLFFSFLVERNAFLSDVTMDEHRIQELAELQKCQYADRKSVV